MEALGLAPGEQEQGVKRKGLWEVEWWGSPKPPLPCLPAPAPPPFPPQPLGSKLH